MKIIIIIGLLLIISLLIVACSSSDEYIDNNINKKEINDLNYNIIIDETFKNNDSFYPPLFPEVKK